MHSDYKYGLWKSYFITFIIIIVIFSTIGIVSLYIPMQSIIKNEAANECIDVANRVTDQINIRISEVKEISYQMSMQDPIYSFSYKNLPMNNEAYLDMIQIEKQLLTYRTANNFITYITIYYPKLNTVVAPEGQYDADYYYKNYMHFDEIKYEDIMKIMQSSHNHYFMPLSTITRTGSGSGNYIVYIQSFPIENSKTLANIVFYINEDSIFDTIGENITSGNKNIVIMTNKGDVIASAYKNSSYIQKIKENIKGSSGTFYLGDKENRSIAAYTSSNDTGWKYVVVLNLKSAFQKVDKIKNLTFILLVICGIIGIIIAYLMAKISYKPWKSLMNHISSIYDDPKKGNKYQNEYLYTKDVINDIITDRKRIENNYKKNKPYIKEKIIRNICEGKDISTDELKEYNINFEYKNYGIIMIHLIPGIIKSNFYPLIISNIEKIEFDKTKVVGFLDHKDKICLLINTESDINKLKIDSELVKRIFKEIRDYVVCPIVAGIGKPYQKLQDIARSYKEAKRALDYSFLIEEDSVITYSEIEENIAKSPSLPINFENVLQNNVKNGDYTSCSKMLDKYFNNLMSEKCISVVHVYYVFYNIIGIILKLCSNLNINIEKLLNKTPEQLLNVDNYQSAKEMIECIYKTYMVVCNYIEQKNESDSSGLDKNIIKYLNEHYMDENLSLVEVADKLGFSSSYLSRYMSKVFGMGFADFVIKIRLEAAKELLLAGDQSVHEIASKVGYSSTNSFIRTFKRNEGITPGQYKDMVLERGNKLNK